MDNKANVKYQVFVSSTYVDLVDERKEITQAILEANCIPAGMELFPASNKSQWEFIKKIIDESDFFLVILAGKYGSEGKDETGQKTSYTEMEFDYAIKTNKPVIALIHAEPDALPRIKCETSKIKNTKLKKLYTKVSSGRLIKKWTNKDDLKSAALAALYEAKCAQDGNAKGWIRADKAATILDESEEKFRVELRRLERDLQKIRDIEHSHMFYIDHLERIIYEAALNPSILKDNKEVEELICNMQYALGVKHQHSD